MLTKVNIEDSDSLRFYLTNLAPVKKQEDFIMSILKGGVSNKTVLCEFTNGEQWVIKQALSKLRVKEDWFSSPERLLVESKAMQWLAKVLPRGSIPEHIFMDEDRFILAMQAIRKPYKNFKEYLLEGNLARQYIADMGRFLGMIHTAGEEDPQLKDVFGEKSFFKSLRIEAYYQFTGSKVPESILFFKKLIKECLEIQKTVVHGDFSPKNILIHHDKLILLDHEVMHFGDPAFDLGFSMTHFLSKANYLSSLREKILDAAGSYWKSYQENYRDWAALEERAVRHLLACLMARVKGRSPLEYFDKASGDRQISSCLHLINNLPENIPAFIQAFGLQLNKLS